MNSKYKTVKYKKNKPSNIEDLVSIEEPLEMVVRYKKENKWVDNSISITMRTPKNDEDLIVGLLFCEGIIQKISEVKKIELFGLENLILTNLSFQEFFKYIKNFSFKKILILFPDPWPKKRHRKRRLINKFFLRNLYEISNKTTNIIISSDDENYINEILYKFHLDKNFILSTSFFGEKLIKTFDLEETKYYKKANKNKRNTYFFLYNVKK